MWASSSWSVIGLLLLVVGVTFRLGGGEWVSERETLGGFVVVVEEVEFSLGRGWGWDGGSRVLSLCGVGAVVLVVGHGSVPPGGGGDFPPWGGRGGVGTGSPGGFRRGI